MTFRVVIPARYASSRLPGKPLLKIAGKPMIQHVYERALSSGAEEVVIATDDERVYDAAQAFDALVLMTSADHHSGTDRLAEVVEQRGYGCDDVIVNVQGDEPMLPVALIRQVAVNLEAHSRAVVATLSQRIRTAAELFDPHAVKVVTDSEGYALYFSRAAIPWDRDAFSVSTEQLPERSEHYRHIGLYAYRAGFLKTYITTAPCALERMESLEQLRVLWRGGAIHVAEAVVAPGHGVDTQEDLARVRQLMEKT
ncbi:MAG: 3-deoxy-manno-octulosonate cytidylyltransferase [Gammaproteobacteria bacterium]|nr:3-deoxy-manno-octulosonate cytidylyltransferase [Gammaproteobacteria bacterium]